MNTHETVRAAIDLIMQGVTRIDDHETKMILLRDKLTSSNHSVETNVVQRDYLQKEAEELNQTIAFHSHLAAKLEVAIDMLAEEKSKSPN
jgi:hypothetical protein